MFMKFRLVSEFSPTGDQPQAIEKLAKGVRAGVPHQVLLGVTGSGKTATMAWVMERAQKPVLVLEPNKTLAAQVYQELKEFFPDNEVHYFVSYYDYYQPEAYIPQSDTYIEKDAKVNEILDRMRHEAVQEVLQRKDVIVVASVSCIYNIGSPEEYQKVSLELRQGQLLTRRALLSHLASLQYERNDIEFLPGTFRVRGDVVEVHAVTGKELIRIEFSGDKIEMLEITAVREGRSDIASLSDAIPTAYPTLRSGDVASPTSYRLFPAKFWVTPEDKLKIALRNIRSELTERLKEFRLQGKNLEAERLEQRTNYDLEMIEESGYCHGIENYSRHMEFRRPGEAPFTLLDYFGDSFLVFVDESHLAYSQLRAMSVQDRMRKEALVEHGFRLPSAADNRPLNFEEFLERAPYLISVSATPGNWELQQAGRDRIAEQLLRPTGLPEPAIEIRPTSKQMENVLGEIRRLKEQNQRALVITLTKRLAEDIASYLQERGVETQWLHSEIKTLERPLILEKLRRGKFDVLVGVNLLREGLDLPEVALVAILDADKEGFLRNKTTLIQTMGRAARHPAGRAILYADKETESMREAIHEVERRRAIQLAHNKKHGITPAPIIKAIRPWQLGDTKKKAVEAEFASAQDPALLEKEMKKAAAGLDFERAAELRDLLEQAKDDTKR
ncbi:excinuclease ABC subunit UvrB [Patescibacteria group bacterium]|nr:excinuclease ABC subunit UvrB [Patescibacteria group bacterium]